MITMMLKMVESASFYDHENSKHILQYVYIILYLRHHRQHGLIMAKAEVGHFHNILMKK